MEGLSPTPQSYDGLTNTYYNQDKYQELIEKRAAEFAQARASGNLGHARVLLTEGHLGDRLSSEEMLKFFDEVQKFWVGRADTQRIDRSHLLANAALEYSYLPPLLEKRIPEEKETLEYTDSSKFLEEARAKEKELAQAAYQSYVGDGNNEAALKIVQRFKLDKQAGQKLAPDVIRRLLSTKDPFDKKKAAALAEEYGIEDEDILEDLTS